MDKKKVAIIVVSVIFWIILLVAVIIFAMKMINSDSSNQNVSWSWNNEEDFNKLVDEFLENEMNQISWSQQISWAQVSISWNINQQQNLGTWTLWSVNDASTEGIIDSQTDAKESLYSLRLSQYSKWRTDTFGDQTTSTWELIMSWTDETASSFDSWDKKKMEILNNSIESQMQESMKLKAEKAWLNDLPDIEFGPIERIEE